MRVLLGPASSLSSSPTEEAAAVMGMRVMAIAREELINGCKFVGQKKRRHIIMTRCGMMP